MTYYSVGDELRCSSYNLGCVLVNSLDNVSLSIMSLKQYKSSIVFEL